MALTYSEAPKEYLFTGPSSLLGFFLFIVDFFFVFVIACIVFWKKRKLNKETKTGTILTRRLVIQDTSAMGSNLTTGRQLVIPGTVETWPSNLEAER